MRRVMLLVVVVAALLPATGGDRPAAAEHPDHPRAIEVGRGPGTIRDGTTRPGIRLESGVVDTSATASPAALTAMAPGPLVVQFAHAIGPAERSALAAAGARVLAVLPDRALRVAAQDPAALAGVPGVRWVGQLTPEEMVHPDIAGQAQQLRVAFDPGRDIGAAATAAAEAGATVLRTYDRGFVVQGNRATAVAVAAATQPAWVEPLPRWELHNEYGGAIIGAPTAHAAGYDGSGQIVAVADTGIGDGTAAGAHPDIPPERIIDVDSYTASDFFGCYDVVPNGAADVDSGHGTHVAGTVLSDGDAAGVGLGSAPGASLYFQAIEEYVDFQGFFPPCNSVDGYYLVGIPDNIRDLIQDAYDVGARIHQDSWGAPVAGDYTVDSEAVDDFTWTHPDLLFVTSAGNAGTDTNPGDGVVDEDSIGSPATAKNALTVGASENAREDNYPCDAALTYVNPDTGTSCSSQAGVNDIFTWSAAWPSDFTNPPLADDPSAGDAEQMAAFSSRGPTDDGRIKPDVVAPGTWILSGYSSEYQEGYGDPVNPQNGLFQYDGWGFPFSAGYKYVGGTSMSSPMAAGAAAVVRDFYATAYSHDASAALVKATLINSAVDLADENNDGAADNDFPIPNVHEGWGRVDVAAAVDDSSAWFDDGSATTGTEVTYAVAVHEGTPLRITLVWSDYAASASCGSSCLVNDLDLVVTGPDGATTYAGNHFSGGWTPPGPSAPDTTNNVENVYIQTPAPGVWTIRVTGAEVPMGPQPFALVIDADFDESIDVTAPAWTGGLLTVSNVTPESAELTWSGASDDFGVVAYDVFAGSDLLLTTDSTSALLTGLLEETTYTVTVQARDAAGNTSTDGPSAQFTTESLDSAPPDWTGITLRAADIGENHARLSWDTPSDFSGVDRYLVYQDGSLIAQPDGQTLVVAGLAPATTYMFKVEARDTRGHTSDDGPGTDVTTARDFADTNGHTFEHDIAWLSGSGITQGCDDTGNFCPDEPINRAQMASLLARALGLPGATGNRFIDVSGVHTANINAIAEAGITIGCTPDGDWYCPDDLVTRAQMATFLDRAFDLLDTGTDSFIDDEGSVHEAAINRVAESEITRGCAVGLYCPDDSVTRGQLAAFLHRTFVHLGLE